MGLDVSPTKMRGGLLNPNNFSEYINISKQWWKQSVEFDEKLISVDEYKITTEIFSHSLLETFQKPQPQTI